jgi:FtsZ-interacting cell division protein ZipA
MAYSKKNRSSKNRSSRKKGGVQTRSYTKRIAKSSNKPIDTLTQNKLTPAQTYRLLKEKISVKHYNKNPYKLSNNIKKIPRYGKTSGILDVNRFKKNPTTAEQKQIKSRSETRNKYQERVEDLDDIRKSYNQDIKFLKRYPQYNDEKEKERLERIKVDLKSSRKSLIM